jgi:hypothetical protein
MNSYQSPIPRTAFGIAAIAVSAITLSLSVILPATLVPDRHQPSVLVASNAAPHAPVEATIIPASIEVVAECEQRTASAPARRARPNGDRET